VVQLFSGGCAVLASLSCKDDAGTGGTEIINATGLTAGQTYRIRVYHYGAGSGSGNFTICVTEAPPPPANDNCSTATSLNVNTSCSYTNGTTDGATASQTGCSGTADDDVWYSFVATNAVQTIKVHPTDASDFVVQLFSGACSSLSSVSCQDATFSGQDEQLSAVGLIPGQTYFIRVYDYYNGNTGDFQICITGTATAIPTNDEPCSAIQLPTVTSNCNYAEFTTVGASASVSAPNPATCAGGSAPQQGGFSASSKDVWFAITVPSSGNVFITSKPNMGSGAITDGVMALYSGSCSALSQIACSDDYSTYPGASNDFLPLISATGLTPGSTVYLRYFGYGSSSGTFGLCVTTATNDNCANALYICDLNGYSASTSAAYTPDRPGNMRGNNEDASGVNMPDGTNTGGIFGQGGSWGTGAPNYDVTINNNSWIKFTAASTTATLQVSIYDCWVGNYPSGGLQMQVFEGTNCTNFVPVSDFKESSSGFSITANNLTVGNDYYLMVDGFAGDICNYTITAQSGVQFPDIADVPPICPGQSVTLTAPAGASSYNWQHDGSTTQSVTVTPSTTQTYFCEVYGLCGYKQMLEATVTVNPTPILNITPSANSICVGSSATLTVSGATNYTWNTSETANSITVSPNATTNYTITGTSNGCTASASVSIAVNALPTLSANPSSTDSNCGGATGALTGASGSGTAPLSYSWTNGSGAVVGGSQNLSGMPAGTYFLEIMDGNGCSDQFGPFSIINPGAPAAPTISVTDNTPCNGTSVSMTASVSSPGATYSWSGPSGYSSTNATVNLTGVDATDQGNYCVTATSSGCTGPATCQTITVLALPPVQIPAASNDSTVCLGNTIQLTASGGITYSWNGPNGFSSNSASISIANAQLSNQGTYTVTGTDANGCSNTDAVSVAILNLPNLTLTSSNQNVIFCLNGLISLSVTGASSYSWSGPDNFTSSNPNPSVTNADASNEGWYLVSGTDVNGCQSTDSLFVKVITDFASGITNGDSLLCPGETATLSAFGGATYLWSDPSGNASSDQVLTITNTTPDQSGWYVVIITDTNGCVETDSAFLQIAYNSDCIFIPDLVTPDFDGKNDNWEILGIENYGKSKVEIYNRWGNLVFSSSPYLNDWNGEVTEGLTLDGKDGKVPVGTYFYILELNEGDQPPFKGYIEVQY
jgi:gliding motility-associated-like protein